MQTENNRKMCKHIKDKENYLIPTTPFAPKRCKKSAKKLDNKECSEFREIRDH